MSEPPPQKRQRPTAITIVGIILFLTALVNLALAAIYFAAVYEDWSRAPAFFAPPESDDLFTEFGQNNVEAVTYAVLGAVQLVIWIGFWRVKRWAWVAAMSWQALKLLVELGNYSAGHVEAPALVSAIVVVFLLNQADVRHAFGILRRENEPSEPPLRIRSVN